ncbi:hypothetical protein F8197_01550 [Duganella sp. FT27W]|nr:hypothetical protein [Duganella sp. FT27W]
MPGASNGGQYRLGVGDVLAITVWDHPELTGAGLPSRSDNLDGQIGPPPATFVIDQQGQLHFPFAGAVPLAGLTREEARDRLAQRLARYFRAPRVTVTVMAYRSQRVYVDGQVRTPGPQPINDIPMTLLEALNRAGGLLPTADQSRITVERAGRRYRIDLVAAMRGGPPQAPDRSAGPAPGQPSAPQSYGAASPAPGQPPGLLPYQGYPGAMMLADGDVVRAPPRDENKVFVGGEVLSPRALTMHDGRLSLGEALGEAGGLNPQSADAGQVYVVRRAQQGDTAYMTGSPGSLNELNELNGLKGLKGPNGLVTAGAHASTAPPAPRGPLVFRLDARSASALALAEQFELQPRDVVYVAASMLTNWHRAISQLFPGELSSAVGVTTRP